MVSLDKNNSSILENGKTSLDGVLVCQCAWISLYKNEAAKGNHQRDVRTAKKRKVVSKFSTRIMESNNFYRSYMAAFEIPSSINQERRTSSAGCRRTSCNIVGLSSTSTSERISYLLPYSSKEGVYNVLPTEQSYLVVKNSAPQVRV